MVGVALGEEISGSVNAACGVERLDVGCGVFDGRALIEVVALGIPSLPEDTSGELGAVFLNGGIKGLDKLAIDKDGKLHDAFVPACGDWNRHPRLAEADRGFDFSGLRPKAAGVLCVFHSVCMLTLPVSTV